MDVEDYALDYYLENIAEQNNQENLDEYLDIDPDTVMVGAAAIAAGGGTLYNIGAVVGFLLAASRFHKAIKVDPERSKWINNILKSGNTWIVHSFPDPVPNAFAITGRHVFITTGLTKILNQREQEGVLLHEVFHNKDLHSWKQIATKSAFTYLIIFVSITSTITIFPGLGMLVAFIMKNAFDIAYARLVGRRHEIKADEFATIHGYGPDLIEAFKKMERWAKSKSSNKQCNKICQLERKISSAIDEHPPTKKRVEIILRKTQELNKILKLASFKKIADYVSGVFKNNG